MTVLSLLDEALYGGNANTYIKSQKAAQSTAGVRLTRLIGPHCYTLAVCGNADFNVPTINLDALRRIQRVSDEIDRLRSLQPGWDTYGAPAIDVAILDSTVKVFAAIAEYDIPDPSVVPTTGGGVQLEWHTAEADVEIEVLSATTIDVYGRPRTQDRNPVDAEGASLSAQELSQAATLLLPL
jgi:hypothetical protein